MPNNIEDFRSKFLTAARNRLLAYDPATASEADLVIQSAVLKAYDIVDQYQVLTPERTSALLAMTQPEFNLWLSDPVDAVRNRIALAKTLASPEAVEIIFADATAAANICASAIALATIFAAPDSLAAVAASPAATAAIAASQTALAAVADNQAAIQALLVNTQIFAGIIGYPPALETVVANATAMALVIDNPAALAALISSPAAIAMAAVSPIAMTAIVDSPMVMALVIDNPAALSVVMDAGNPVAFGKICGSAVALHAIAKDTAARTMLAEHPDLQANALKISNTLDGAGNFTKAASSALLTGANATTYGLVSGNPYATKTGNAAAVDAAIPSACFVFVRTMGYVNNTYREDKPLYAKHMQTKEVAGSVVQNGGLQTAQPAKFICIGGAILHFQTSSGTSWTAGMTFDCWEAQ